MLNRIKIVNNVIIFNNWEFSFSEKVVKKINELYYEYLEKNLEIGGYIFFSEEVQNRFRAKWVSKPNKKDIFESSYYSLDLKSEQNNIKKHLNGMRYLAIWHSHLKSSTSPSKLDLVNAESLLVDLKEDLIISLIINDKEINIIIFYFGKNNKIKKTSKVISRKGIL